jgi:23S rRNA pseudouridine1911/1915/1917 synthase
MKDRPTVFHVGESDRGKRLDRYLHERLPGVSRTRLQQAIQCRVELSWGGEPHASSRMRPGGRVLVGFPPNLEVPVDASIPVLARGNGWLAVDKPAGFLVHPTNAIRENSLLRILCRQLGAEDLRPVHRLDRETSGVLLVAEESGSARFLSEEFATGRVRKEYVALVEGVPDGEEGMIDRPICDARGAEVFVRREAGPVGQPAVTRWRVERRYFGRTLLRLFPETGRRHQLRVHLAHLGHPVVGDLLYGRPDRDYLDWLAEGRDRRSGEGGPLRHLLHCARMAFSMPSGEDADISSPLPLDFLAALGSAEG